MALGLAAALLCNLVFAAEPAPIPPEQRIGTTTLTLPLKLVDGHLVISAALYDSAGASDAVSLEVALDYPDTLTLDGNQFGWLKLDGRALREGRDVFTKVVFANGATLMFPAREIKPERDPARGPIHDRLTQLFSTQLEERKLKGMLGLGFFNKYILTLDVPGRQLVLSPRGSVSLGGSGDFSGTFELREERVTLPLRSAIGPDARMVLGSSNYDTIIDAETAKRLGQPAGGVEPVALTGAGDIELSRLLAFRPGKVPPGKDVVLHTGVNLLESYRLDVDFASRRVKFVQQKEAPPKSAADAAFFAAENANTADAYLAFLKAHPQSRLAADAATRLMRLRLNEWGVADAELMEALQFVVDTSPPERRAENCLVYVNRFAAEPGKTDLTIQAAQLALSHARGAVTVQDVYRLHRILGEQYLAQNNLDAAWKHLLSAGFITIARDPGHTFLVALNLGRVYEKQERWVRAYSRYKAALAAGAPMTAAVKKEITDALERLKAKIPPEQLQMLDS